MKETYRFDDVPTSLGDCMTQLVQMLRAMGIVELTIEPDGVYYLINNERPLSQETLHTFYTYVTELYELTVAAK
jgi:hypothetical protein